MKENLVGRLWTFSLTPEEDLSPRKSEAGSLRTPQQWEVMELSA